MQKPSDISFEQQYHLMKLAERAQALLIRSGALHRDMDVTRRSLVRMNESFSSEFENLKRDVSLLDQETLVSVDSVKRVASGFHGAVRVADLSRLQSRVDVWAPERRLSRDQFRALLSDSFE